MPLKPPNQWPAPGTPQEGLDLERRPFLIEIAKLKRGARYASAIFALIAVLLGVIYGIHWSEAVEVWPASGWFMS